MRNTLLLLILLLAASVSGHAQSGSAKATDASAHAVSFHIYRSDNHGLSWNEVGKGLPRSGRIHALLIADTIAYAGTDNGLFLSDDGGRAWSARVLASASVLTPISPVQCFVAAGRRVYAGTRGAGVFVTEDRGRFWRQVANNLTDRNVRALASRGSTIYAGTDAGGVFALPEGGDLWMPLSQGLPERPQVFDLAVREGAVYAALYSKGLYRLDVRARQWERVDRVTPLRFVVRGNSLLAGHNPGGIYRSVDDGATWRPVSGLSENAPIWVLGHAGPNLLAGTSPGTVSLSEDSGASWKPSAAGLPPGSAVVAIGTAPNYTLVAILQDSRKAKQEK